MCAVSSLQDSAAVSRALELVTAALAAIAETAQTTRLASRPHTTLALKRALCWAGAGAPAVKKAAAIVVTTLMGTQEPHLAKHAVDTGVAELVLQLLGASHPDTVWAAIPVVSRCLAEGELGRRIPAPTLLHVIHASISAAMEKNSSVL